MIRLFDDQVRVLRLVIATSGMRLDQIGRACGVSGSLISLVAGGVSEPSPALKTKLAQLFQMDENRLFRSLKAELPWLYEREVPNES